jgi:hypothetical protein
VRVIPPCSAGGALPAFLGTKKRSKPAGLMISIIRAGTSTAFYMA